jgi:hypothetical protein
MREGRIVAELTTPVEPHVILEAASGVLSTTSS